MKTTIQINPNVVVAISLFIKEKENNRFSGINIELKNHRIILVGSTRNILLAVDCGTLHRADCSFIVPSASLKHIKKHAKGKHFSDVAFVYDDETKQIEINYVGMNLSTTAINDCLVNWKKLLPTSPFEPSFANYAVEYFGFFAKVEKLLNVKFVCYHRWDESAVLLNIDSDDYRVLGLIMCRKRERSVSMDDRVEIPNIFYQNNKE